MVWLILVASCVAYSLVAAYVFGWFASLIYPGEPTHELDEEDRIFLPLGSAFWPVVLPIVAGVVGGKRLVEFLASNGAGRYSPWAALARWGRRA